MVLTDRAVSRLHAELTPRDDGLWVCDLGSRNGSFIAGVKVHDARVPPGAILRFGTTEITVTYDPPSPVEGLWPEESFYGLQGGSAMRAVFGVVAELAPGDAAVLFVGESGTGKNALARAMHEASPRSGGPLVVMDCRALSGAVEAASMVEEALNDAEGGTLLLDEPSELSPAVQRELLATLDAKRFRVMASSQCDLRVRVNQGAFREELYSRLAAGATVRLPPLRERLADLPLLLEHFLGDRAALATSALLGDLARMPWTGNVRELLRYAERLRATGRDVRDFKDAAERRGDASPAFEREDATIEAPPRSRTMEVEVPALTADDRAAELARTSREPSPLPAGLEPWFETGFKQFRERWIELGEREYLRRLMKRTGRSSGAASRDAGLERTYLYRLLKKHGV